MDKYSEFPTDSKGLTVEVDNIIYPIFSFFPQAPQDHHQRRFSLNGSDRNELFLSFTNHVVVIGKVSFMPAAWFLPLPM